MHQHHIDIKCWHSFEALLSDIRQAIHYCLMLNGVVQGSVSLQRVDPAEAAKRLFWCWKSPRETSFSLRINFHQPTNASCFKEKTCTLSPLQICHPVLTYSYPEHLSQDLKVCIYNAFISCTFSPLLTIPTHLWVSWCRESAFTHQLLPLTVSAFQVVCAPRGQSARYHL